MQPTDILTLKGEYTAEKPKLLLHTCCAVCLANFLEFFQDSFNITVLWFNPNIHGLKENKKRKETLRKYCNNRKIKIVIDSYYDIKEFIRKSSSKEGRCYECYRWRLEKTVEYAKENDFKTFSTTLLTSPMQKRELLANMAKDLAVKNDLFFFNYDTSQSYDSNIIKDEGYYTQAYCGCIFSEEERYK